MFPAGRPRYPMHAVPLRQAGKAGTETSSRLRDTTVRRERAHGPEKSREQFRERVADDLRVCLALREFDHLALEEIDALHFARLVLGDGLRIGNDDLLAQRLDRPGVAHLLQPALPDDLHHRLAGM